MLLARDTSGVHYEVFVKIKTMQADIQQLRSQNSRASEQLAAKEAECRQKEEVIKEKDEALLDSDMFTSAMQADIQQLISQNSRASEQLAAKEAECTQKDEIVREKSATIEALQAKIHQLRDQPAVPHKVSRHTSISIHT